MKTNKLQTIRVTKYNNKNNNKNKYYKTNNYDFCKTTGKDDGQ